MADHRVEFTVTLISVIEGTNQMAQDFTMFSGDTKDLLITVVDGDGIAVDITDSSIRWKMARSRNSASADLSKSNSGSPSDIEIISGIDGTFSIHIEPEDTEDLQGKFYHEAEIILGDGTVGTIVSGTITIVVDLIHAV